MNLEALCIFCGKEPLHWADAGNSAEKCEEVVGGKRGGKLEEVSANQASSPSQA